MNSNINPKVSIIMPSYNSSKYITDSIKSVQAQSYLNWELLITNDCSTDESVEIINEFIKKDSRIKLFNLEQNSGVAAARNKSIDHANGDYFAFLDSDDIWLPTKLQKQIDFMIKNDYLFSYTAYRKIDNNNNYISKPISVSIKGVNFYNLLKHNEIGCLTAIVHKSILKDKRMIKIGHEDYVLWLSILKEGFMAFGLNEVLAGYRVGNESISSNKLKAAGFTWNIFRNIEKLNFFRSLYYFTNYAFTTVIKYLK